jgi:hypothetical protein
MKGCFYRIWICRTKLVHWCCFAERHWQERHGLTTAWSELVAPLLDNYCKSPQASGSAFSLLLLSSFLVVIIMREEKRLNGVIRRILVMVPSCLDKEICYEIAVSVFYSLWYQFIVV